MVRKLYWRKHLPINLSLLLSYDFVELVDIKKKRESINTYFWHLWRTIHINLKLFLARFFLFFISISFAQWYSFNKRNNKSRSDKVTPSVIILHSFDKQYIWGWINWVVGINHNDGKIYICFLTGFYDLIILLRFVFMNNITQCNTIKPQQLYSIYI